MRKILFFSSILLAGIFVGAQEIVVATGLTKGKIQFNDFRKIDSERLNSSNVMLTKADKINFETKETEVTKVCNCGNYIAAMTESINGDLFYLPMHGKQVVMVNSSSKDGVLIDIPNSQLNVRDQSTFHARMTTASDGYMYSLNNIGSELLRISPNGSVQNLGAIPQLAEFAKASGVETSVYGGDLIADAFGNLYAITASANVFKINVRNMNAEFLGSIKGLPEKFTVNGAAVDKDGSVLLGTSSLHKALYSLDFTTLEASFKSDYDLSVYDMSSPYFLRQAELDAIVDLKSHYSLYPTVVKTSQLNIVSNSNERAKLDITVWNIHNKVVYSNTVNIESVGEFQVNLGGALQPGVYILKAVNHEGNEVINTKFNLVR